MATGLTGSLNLLDPHADFEDSRNQTVLVTIAQVLGLALICAAFSLLRVLDTHLEHYAHIAIWTAFFLLAAVVACWYDRIGNVIWRAFQPPQTADYWVTPLAESTRKAGLLKVTLALVVMDTAILAFLIVLTGGFGHSPLDPLLPAIPIIAIIIRQPGRHIKLTLGLQVIILVGPVVHHLLHVKGILHPGILDGSYRADVQEPNFIYAFVVVASGALGLSLIELYLTHGYSAPVRAYHYVKCAPEVSQEANCKKLKGILVHGVKRWVIWLELQGLPTQGTSTVHDEVHVAQQAEILSLPHWLEGADRAREARRITRNIAFLTHAAHFIDDHFDPLRLRCLMHGLPEAIESGDPAKVLACEKRVQNLLRRMEKLAPKERRSYINRAVLRVVYGGLIQNAPDAETRDARLTDYVGFICLDSALASEIKGRYRALLSAQKLSLWVTTKVVIELLDCCGPGFSPSVSEFFNLLYGPMLYFADREGEVEREGFGDAFGKSRDDVIKNLPNEKDMGELIRMCQELVPTVFPQGVLPASRQAQLRHLREVYQEKLPRVIYTAYNSFLEPTEKVLGKSAAV